MDEADYSFLLSLLLESLKNPVGISSSGVFLFICTTDAPRTELVLAAEQEGDWGRWSSMQPEIRGACQCATGSLGRPPAMLRQP